MLAAALDPRPDATLDEVEIGSVPVRGTLKPIQ